MLNIDNKVLRYIIGLFFLGEIMLIGGTAGHLCETVTSSSSTYSIVKGLLCAGILLGAGSLLGDRSLRHEEIQNNLIRLQND